MRVYEKPSLPPESIVSILVHNVGARDIHKVKCSLVQSSQVDLLTKGEIFTAEASLVSPQASTL